MDLVWCQCNFGLGHCSFVDVGRELGQVVGYIGVVVVGIEVVVDVGNCRIVEVVGLERVCELELGLVNVHLHGILDCSNVHHMNHHRTGLMCHIDLCMLGHLSLVDIVVVERLVVVLVGQLANDLR